MPLRELLAVCAPPARPIHVPTASQWSDLEALVGHALAPDYRALLERYGSGAFGAFDEQGSFFDLAFVLSPGEPPGKHDVNAIPLMMELTRTVADIKSQWPEQVPFPVWPEPGGLLYVGGTTTTHSIYWRTTGSEDAWTCVVGDYGCDNWFEWSGDLTSLLAAMVAGRVPDWIVAGVARFPLVFLDLDALERVRLT